MIKPIFFDLDGTLTDPKEGITRSIQYALERMGLAVPEIDELTWCIGPPLQQSFAKMVGTANVEQSIKIFRERFADVGWRENVPYDGVSEVLRQLSARGHPLYVATSKPLVYAARIIDFFGLDGHFQKVFGAELDGTLSDKRELLRHAAADISLRGGAMMIGDRSHDMLGAVANEMKGIGVTYGYGSREELLAAGAQCLAGHPSELVGCVQALVEA